MAVARANPKYQSETSHAVLNQDGRFVEVIERARITYIVDTAPGEGAVHARVAQGVPSLGATFVSGALTTIMRCEEKDVEQAEDDLFYVHVTASTLIYEDPDQDKPPEQRAPEAELDAEMVPTVVYEDVEDGRMIANSVGEPFRPVVPTPVIVLVLHRWETGTMSQAVSQMIQYAGRVNSETFWGAGPGQVLMDPPRRKAQITSARKLFSTTYRFKFAIVDPLLTWDYQPLDQGSKHLPATFNGGDVYGTDFTDADLITARNKELTPTTINLDLRGRQSFTGPHYYDGTVKPAFRVHKRADFNDLGLGSL